MTHTVALVLELFAAGCLFGGILCWRWRAWTQAAAQERLTLSDSHAEIGS